MKALDLADYIINKTIDNKNPISNLQLQKILYFVNLYHIKLTHKFLIDDEPFMAWQHGPVVSDVYAKYATYGGFLITKSNEIIVENLFDTNNENLTLETKEKIDDFIKFLSKIDPWSLVDYSHRIGGAWQKSYIPNQKAKIKNSLILEEALS